MPKVVAQCRKNPVQYLNTLRHYSISLYINQKHYLNTWPPYLNTLTNYTLSQNIAELYPILLHRAEIYPILTHYRRKPIKLEYFFTRVVSQLESSTKNPINFISQPGSSITSPESSRFGWRSLLGSQLSARVGSL